MTSSHQNSNIFCCGVHFSQEWFSRIGQNHKISSSSLSRNVSILLLTKKIYSKINISRVISCYINQENIISNKKPDVTEYSYGITKWTIWSLQKDVLKSDPTISVLDTPEKTPELTWYANMFKNNFLYVLYYYLHWKPMIFEQNEEQISIFLAKQIYYFSIFLSRKHTTLWIKKREKSILTV